MTKYIFITGNIIGFNKCIFISCLGALLKENNLKINIKKITNNKPAMTFVTSTGHELDLDLGFYERIAEIITSPGNNIIGNDYDNISFIELNSEKYDIILVDTTKMDMVKYFLKNYGKHNVINIHFPHIIKDFNSIINKNNNIYKIPYLLFRLNLHKKVLKLLEIQSNDILPKWEKIYNKLSNLDDIIYVYIIIKFTDSYISLEHALKHACYSLNKDIKIVWVDPTSLTKTEIINILNYKKGGIIVPGGFGKNGFDNKIEAITIARENNIPFLGICYGMQIMVIEYARNVLNIKDASTEEIDYLNKFTHIVHLNNKNNPKMRLGNRIGKIVQESIVEDIYKLNVYIERYRHKYKVNNDYIKLFKDNGLFFTGLSLDNKYLEIAEVPEKDFFIGVQFHPELNSTIFKPNPVILAFVKSVILFK